MHHIKILSTPYEDLSTLTEKIGTLSFSIHMVLETTVKKPYQFNSKSFSKYHDVLYPTSKSNNHPDMTK
jgi:hypothetical protein